MDTKVLERGLNAMYSFFPGRILEIFFCLMLSIAGNVKGSLVAVTISARTTSGIASIAMRRIANALLLIVALLNDKSGLRENSVQRCDLESYLRSPLCLIICVKK